MKSYNKPSFRAREKITHKLLHYINNKTTQKQAEWRDSTITFFYNLHEILNDNAGLNLLVHRDDGLKIYSGSSPVVYLHFYQKQFLVHARQDYLIWDDGDNIFETRHDGSWPRMWKATTRQEVMNLLEYIAALPKQALTQSGEPTRTIPVWVQHFVFERDRGRCVACDSNVDLCFDHILPFSKGGSSNHPNNLQLLCSKCNLEKSANFWPVKI